MKVRYIVMLVLAAVVGLSSVAMADQFNFSFSGNGITASGILTVSPVRHLVSTRSPESAEHFRIRTLVSPVRLPGCTSRYRM